MSISDVTWPASIHSCFRRRRNCQFGPSFSGPAISGSASSCLALSCRDTSMVRHFQVVRFQSTPFQFCVDAWRFCLSASRHCSLPHGSIVRTQHQPPVMLKAVRNRPDGTVRSRPDAARSRPDTARNSTVERSERNKSHTNYMLTTCSVPSFCHVQDEHGKKWEN